MLPFVFSLGEMEQTEIYLQVLFINIIIISILFILLFPKPNIALKSLDFWAFRMRVILL